MHSEHKKFGKILPKWISFCLVLTLCLSLLFSCKSRQNVLGEKWRKNPCLGIQYWGKEWKQIPFEDRIKAAPPELIEKIHIENELQGFKERPEPFEPTPEIYKALSSIKDSLPGSTVENLENQFIGVFSVKKLGGSGYTDIVYDSEGDEKYTLIVLDSEILLKMTANEWATWKVNSTFKPDKHKDIELRAVIEHEENDNTENAFRFILLHELGHALGAMTKVHSSWVNWYTKRQINMDFPFQKLSEDNKIESLFEDRFPERRHVQVYAFEKSKLRYTNAKMVYYNLINYTNFPSLYAAQNLWEDFAESFATYVHIVIDKRPWKVIVEKPDEDVFEIDSCWGQKRCEQKEWFMAEWMINPNR